MNIFELFGTIAINNKGANKGIDETTTKAKTLANTFGKIGQEALKVGKAVAKGMAVVGAAGTAAVGLLLKNSIGNYAEYEQLVGGIETLFKDSQGTMLKYAQNAYKTAGLSANEYMATATSFAASLLQGLGGDTAAAATMTDMAIQDMADNANKMGTDISMIQNAYQGFAKRNYTMLDNLKLGYGGTATEMARLINDSGVMGETFVATAENLNEISFAKMIEAIHVIQKEMGITGTTAKEAEKTITGSFNAWKSAGSNMLTAIASGDKKSIKEATEAFTAQTKVLLDNLAPVVSNVVGSIGTLLTELLPEIGKHAMNFGAEIIASIVNGITGSNFSAEDVKAAVQQIVDIVVGTWNSVTTAIGNALAGINDFFAVTIPDAWKSMVEDIKQWWNDNVKAPIDNAIMAVREFLGMKADKTVTVTVHYATSGDEFGGGVGQRFGTPNEGTLRYSVPIGPPLPDSTNASGLRYVPRDGHIARLHLGEMVLPRHEADAHRSGRDRGTDTSRLETAVNSLIALTQQLVANTAGGQNVVLDTGILVGQMAPRLDAQLGTLTARKERRG